MKNLIFITGVIFLFSCNKYRMLDGIAKPVYFSVDSTVYEKGNTENYSIYYTDLLSVRMNSVNSVDIFKNAPSKAIISQPTFFRIKSNPFLVYPGENLIVSKGEYNEFLLTDKKGNSTRNNELLFFKKFSEISYYPMFKNYPATPITIDSILLLEEKWRSEIPLVKAREQKKFDSLAAALNVSSRFKKLTKNFLFGRYELGMLDFYKIYKDSLIAHGIYTIKMRQTMKFFNNIADPSAFDNVKVIFNEDIGNILPVKIGKIATQEQFAAAFDTVATQFNGIAADYLLTQLMYQSYKMDVPVDEEYMKKYSKVVKVKEYKNLIGRLQKQWEANKTRDGVKTDMLLLPDGNKRISFSDMIARHKGKIILLDFWAHWCAPCHDDVPALKQLMESYKDSNIVFIRVSIDREVQPWQKAVIADGININNNYLFLYHIKAPFIVSQHIDEIPRYMLVDKNGEIVNPYLPGPRESGLKEIIDNLLSK